MVCAIIHARKCFTSASHSSNSFLRIGDITLCPFPFPYNAPTITAPAPRRTPRPTAAVAAGAASSELLESEPVSLGSSLPKIEVAASKSSPALDVASASLEVASPSSAVIPEASEAPASPPAARREEACDSSETTTSESEEAASVPREAPSAVRLNTTADAWLRMEEASLAIEDVSGRVKVTSFWA